MATVLVCEDDADIRALVAAALAPAGHGVVEAGDVASALDALAAGGVDVVVTDIALPDGSGVDVCRAGRAAGARVVAMTATTSAALAEEVAAYSATILRKPFTVAQLLAAIAAPGST